MDYTDFSSLCDITPDKDPVIIREQLRIIDCVLLETLPKILFVESHLLLSNCKNLRSLPETLIIGGDLDLRQCRKLDTFPKNLKVPGNLWLIECTSLENISGYLEVEGRMDVSGCTNLATLPETLKVYDYLDVCGCTKLMRLPKNLELDGELLLSFDALRLVASAIQSGIHVSKLDFYDEYDHQCEPSSKVLKLLEMEEVIRDLSDTATEELLQALMSTTTSKVRRV